MVKNVAGYDVHKLLVGSFGTLAVILEATFKLQPLPEADSPPRVRTSQALDPLFRLGSALADSPLAPRFVEIVVEEDAPRARLVVGLAGLVEEVEEAGRRAVAMAAESGRRAGTRRASSTTGSTPRSGNLR